MRRRRIDWIDLLIAGIGVPLYFYAAAAVEMATSHVDRSHLTWSHSRGAGLVGLAILVVPFVVRAKLFGPRATASPRPGPLWFVVELAGFITGVAGSGMLADAATGADLEHIATGAALLVLGALCMRVRYFTSRGG